MRKFTDGSGADSTAAAKAYLLGTATPIIFTMVKIQMVKWLDSVNAPFGLSITPSNFTKSFLLTDCPAAIVYTPVGTFRTSAVKHGAMPFTIGIDFQPFEVIWSPASSDMVLPISGGGGGGFGGAPGITALEGARHGFFDSAIVSVYKVVMPSLYDANTYGVCLLNAGAVDEATVEGGQITFKVGSIIDQQDQQVPSQLIGPNSRFASIDPTAYVGVSTHTAGGGANDAVRWTQYQADRSIATQTASRLTSFNYPDSFHLPATGYFDGGYVIWTGGPLLGMRRAIAHSVADAVNFRETFYLAQPFPYDQTPFDTGFSFGFPFDAYALRQPLSTESSGTYNGFGSVPAPEDAF